MAIIQSEIKVLDEKKGKVLLRNRFDYGQAITDARSMHRTNDDFVPMGTIPREMFSYVPWLMEANRCRAHGDMAGWQKNIMTFFRLYPRFGATFERKLF